jgi:hypothetical protein
MKKITFLVFVLTFSLTFSQNSYNVETLNESYQNLQNSNILTNNDWDDPNLSAPIGFNFQIETQSFSTIYIPDWSVGGIASSSPTNVGAIPVFIPIAQDIISRGVNISPISYKTEGTVGSRIFKLEWNNFGFFDDSTNNDFMNMQISFQYLFLLYDV